MKIGIVGGGNMGLAYARSLVNKNIIDSNNLFIYESYPEQVIFLRNLEIAHIRPELDDDLSTLDVLIVAVKPQSFLELASTLKDRLSADTLIISIMAGVKVDVIKDKLKVENVVRAMPNTPCQNGLGATGYLLFDGISEDAQSIVSKVLSSTGMSVQVSSEDEIDSVTALSGSGPAYVFAFAEALQHAGEEMGLGADVSKKLAVQTLKGAVNLMETSGKSFDELITAVKSKGGTTEAALNKFADLSFETTVEQSLNAAKVRASELSNLIQ